MVASSSICGPRWTGGWVVPQRGRVAGTQRPVDRSSTERMPAVRSRNQATRQRPRGFVAHPPWQVPRLRGADLQDLSHHGGGHRACSLCWCSGSSGWVSSSLPYAYLAALAVVLTRIDLAVHRLPDVLVLPAYPILVVLFAIECAITGEWWPLATAAIGGATTRKQRDIAKGRLDGRSTEIQRLIGRSLRSVFDLEKLGPRTMWIDCDVLQADGGTRTAAITGASLAVTIACQKLLGEKKIASSPMLKLIAAVSAGIVEGSALVDLNYEEDKAASVDFNLVATQDGEFVEIQGSGEEATFTQAQLDEMLALGRNADCAIDRSAAKRARPPCLNGKVHPPNCADCSKPGKGNLETRNPGIKIVLLPFRGFWLPVVNG